MNLSTGAYHTSKFDIEPGATINLDISRGPVVVYVENTTIFRGSVSFVGGTIHPEDFLIAHLGSSIVSVQARVIGTIFAPHATIDVDIASAKLPYIGALFGNTVFIHQGSTVTLAPFMWQTIADQPASLGPSGPFPTFQSAVNHALAVDMNVYEQYGDEGAQLTYQNPDGYFNTPTTIGRHSTDSTGTHYSVKPTTASIPPNGTLKSMDHSHPEGGEAGPEDLNNANK